jgi:hypothetical protein
MYVLSICICVLLSTFQAGHVTATTGFGTKF